MIRPLTPERLAAVYDCLRAFPPFDRWRLPPAAMVEFKICRDWESRGYLQAYCYDRGRNEIAVNDRWVGHFDTLAGVIAHEMVHLYQRLRNTETPNAEHNAEFSRLAKRVARQFGFDPKAF